ncbi:sulfotransferase domain-containing protein [Demequina subtropica]|uniref:sulfotransferase domain-containing protein n=1 Tax=Demequina subtropica TaxID=1638989 RepID=UPI000A4995D2|nr:sulfotransferase domain-containing protein [Demequina subtropica]
MVDKVPVVYVAGWGRSGTTLIDRILGQSPDLMSLGEVGLLPERGIMGGELCGCGLAFQECPFWTAVGERAFGGWDKVDAPRMKVLFHDLGRVRHDLLPRFLVERGDYLDRVREYLDFYTAVLVAAHEESGRIPIDSSKHPTVASLLSRAEGLDVRVLHVVRDPRGVAYSWTKAVTRTDAGVGSVEEITRLVPERSGWIWLRMNAVAGSLRRKAAGYARVRYEDAVADPAGVLGGALDRLGLPSAGVPGIGPGGEIDLAACHTVAGNPSRMRVGATRLRLDSEWRTALPAGTRRRVGLVTTPLRKRYGY